MPDSPLAPRNEETPTPRWDEIRARTPARILVGRAGSSYQTQALLNLRQDHAAALDAVRSELDLARDFGPDFIERFGLFEVGTRARSKREYLMRPDLGRQLDDEVLARLDVECPRGATLQVAIGDGLSAAAVAAQVPQLLPLLESRAKERGWTFGRPFVIRYCRVGVLNDIGARLDPALVLLLVGERPGLTTSDSLSAYMAYRPRAGHTDAQRNLISNIHAHGLSPDEAARQIIELASVMLAQATSGVSLQSSPILPSLERAAPSHP